MCRDVTADDVRHAKATVRLWAANRSIPHRYHDDIASASLAGLVSAADTWDPEQGEWTPWMLAHAVRAAVDWLRVAGPYTRYGWRRHPEASPHPTAGWVNARHLWGDTPDDPANVVCGTAHVEWLVGKLSGRRREVVVRCVLGDVAQQTLAAEWEVTEGRVSRIKRAALAQLRRTSSFVGSP